MGLSILVNHESRGHTFYYAFVVLLNALDDLLDCREELFIEVSIEEFVAFHHSSISHL